MPELRTSHPSYFYQIALVNVAPRRVGLILEMLCVDSHCLKRSRISLIWVYVPLIGIRVLFRDAILPSFSGFPDFSSVQRENEI